MGVRNSKRSFWRTIFFSKDSLSLKTEKMLTCENETDKYDEKFEFLKDALEQL